MTGYCVASANLSSAASELHDRTFTPATSAHLPLELRNSAAVATAASKLFLFDSCAGCLQASVCEPVASSWVFALGASSVQ